MYSEVTILYLPVDETICQCLVVLSMCKAYEEYHRFVFKEELRMLIPHRFGDFLHTNECEPQNIDEA